MFTAHIAANLPLVCNVVTTSLHLIYRKNLLRGGCKFAARLLLLCYKFAAFFLDICCMYSYKFATFSSQFCRVFAWNDPDYDIYRELETNYIFKNPKLGI
jgi:hypothetical protein